jgi:hypothetical protein
MEVYLLFGLIALFLIGAIASSASEPPSQPFSITVTPSPKSSVGFGEILLVLLIIGGLIVLLTTLTG